MSHPTKSPIIFVGRGYSVQFTLRDYAEGVARVGAEWSPKLPKENTRVALMAGERYRAASIRFADEVRKGGAK